MGTVFAARATTVGLTVASVIVTTRILDPTRYGTFAYVSVIATVLFTVGSAWSSPAVSRFGREELDRHGRMNVITWERLVITAPAVSFVVAGVVVFALSGGLPARFPWYLVVAAIGYGIALVFSDHIVYVLQALARMRLASLGIVARQAAVFGALIALLALGSHSVGAVAVVTLVGSAVLTAAFVPFAWRRAIWPPTTDPSVRRRLLRFSLPMFAFTLSQYVIQTIDLPLIGIFRSPRDVGLYALAYQSYTVLQQLAATSVAVLTPLFVSLRTAGRESVVRLYVDRTVWQVTFLSAAAVGIVTPLIPVLLPLLFGNRFGDASTPLVILFGANLLLVTANLFAPVLLLHEASRYVGWSNGIAAAMNVALDLILLGGFGFGIWSAAAATAISVGVIVVAYAYAARTRSGARGHLRPIVFLPAAVALIPTLALTPALGVAVGIPAAFASAAVILARGRLFSPSDAELLEHLSLPRGARRVVRATIAFGSRA
jgi:O-antigen/teichoic acid export membrane protein